MAPGLERSEPLRSRSAPLRPHASSPAHRAGPETAEQPRLEAKCDVALGHVGTAVMWLFPLLVWVYFDIFFMNV